MNYFVDDKLIAEDISRLLFGSIEVKAILLLASKISSKYPCSRREILDWWLEIAAKNTEKAEELFSTSAESAVKSERIER